jgi:hypothetical protein
MGDVGSMLVCHIVCLRQLQVTARTSRHPLIQAWARAVFLSPAPNLVRVRTWNVTYTPGPAELPYRGFPENIVNAIRAFLRQSQRGTYRYTATGELTDNPTLQAVRDG